MINKEQLLLQGIRQQREELEKQEKEIQDALDALQDVCPHTNATKKYRSNTGNYDPGADCEWYEYKCPDCGKYWSEDK